MSLANFLCVLDWYLKAGLVELEPLVAGDLGPLLTSAIFWHSVPGVPTGMSLLQAGPAALVGAVAIALVLVGRRRLRLPYGWLGAAALLSAALPWGIALVRTSRQHRCLGSRALARLDDHWPALLLCYGDRLCRDRAHRGPRGRRSGQRCLAVHRVILRLVAHPPPGKQDHGQAAALAAPRPSSARVPPFPTPTKAQRGACLLRPDHRGCAVLQDTPRWPSLLPNASAARRVQRIEIAMEPASRIRLRLVREAPWLPTGVRLVARLAPAAGPAGSGPWRWNHALCASRIRAWPTVSSTSGSTAGSQPGGPRTEGVRRLALRLERQTNTTWHQAAVDVTPASIDPAHYTDGNLVWLRVPDGAFKRALAELDKESSGRQTGR